MSHGSETRRQRGGDTGVKGRRSREGAGLGESLRATGPGGKLKDSVKDNIKATEQTWNDVSHEWFGTDRKSFPYNMKKWDKNTAPSLINKSRDKYTTFENSRDSAKMDGVFGESLMLPIVQRGKSYKYMNKEEKQHFVNWRNTNVYGEKGNLKP